jgi:hypothetical protein
MNWLFSSKTFKNTEKIARGNHLTKVISAKPENRQLNQNSHKVISA